MPGPTSAGSAASPDPAGAGAAARAKPFRSVNIVSSGHTALDHRLFDKEARTLLQSFESVRVIAHHEGPTAADGIEIIPLAGRRSRLVRFLVLPWRCLRLILQNPAQVVHIQDAELLLICPALKLLTQSVVLYDVHEDFGTLMLTRDWIPPPLRKPVRFMLSSVEKLLALSADGIVGVTTSLAAKFWNRRKVAAYNLPSLSFIHEARAKSLPAGERAFDMVHLGSLCQARLEFLAEVIRALLRRRGHARVRIIGLHPGQLTWAREHLPSESVELVGKVPYSEITGLLADCRIGVNVHPWPDPHLQVAVPVKVFEYMACGCCVVSSIMPELANLLDDETREVLPIVEGADVEGFAAAADSLLADGARMARARAVLAAKIERVYNWQAEGEKLLRFYEKMLS